MLSPVDAIASTLILATSAPGLTFSVIPSGSFTTNLFPIEYSFQVFFLTLSMYISPVATAWLLTVALAAFTVILPSTFPAEIVNVPVAGLLILIFPVKV